MRRLNSFTTRQISNCTSQFQNAMIGTRRQVELAHCRPHQTLTFILQLAKLPDLGNPHVRVADDV
jgi:hypothetical protein